MQTIEFTAQGYSATHGAFSAGDRKTVTAAEADHFVDDAMAAVRVAGESAPDVVAADNATTAQPKPSRKTKAAP